MNKITVLALLISFPTFAQPKLHQGASPAETIDSIRQSGKRVVTFIGYSGAGYEDPAKMEQQARDILSQYNPRETIVNIGATAIGIGEVYSIAKSMGFETTGIVSSQATANGGDPGFSAYVDGIYIITDSSWGGTLDNGNLAPTSEAMVGASDDVYAIGGGAIGRDEFLAARRSGSKYTLFYPAEMNHQVAIQKAQKKNQPAPTSFQGDLYKAVMGAE
jgi:hypothetical protein